MQCQPPKERKVYDLVFKEEHMALYDMHHLPWPPPLSDSPYCDFYKTLGERRAQLVWFLNRVWPATEVGFEHAQFVDSNETISRLVRWSLKYPEATEIKNPWQRRMHTLTGHSKMIVRFIDAQSGELVLRELLNYEPMRIIGWGKSMWSTTGRRDSFDLGLCQSLAGNAFSAYALGPALTALFAMYKHQDPVPDEEDVAEDIGSSDAETQSW